MGGIMRKKYIIISIVSGMLILVCFFIFFIQRPNELELNREEKVFIQQNQNTYFFMGYYVTPSEKLVMNKLCTKISEDTGLNISPFEGTWDNNIQLLQSGKLPILANMNITKGRLGYTNFTSSFAGLSIGIYSNYDNKIVRYEDLEGKTIGIEKNVCLLQKFKMKYPTIQFSERYYNSLDSLREALSNGEIDCFISSNSYNEDLRFYYFFRIEGLSRDNNYIGVNKEYPILYQIINKEVEHLIHTDWDQEVRELVDFELETKHMEFTDAEKRYIEEKQSICIGIPKEFNYYAYGDPYNPKGIIPEFFHKIEFLTDLQFIYCFDRYENLIKRKDIDIIVSSEHLPFASTSPILFNKLIAVSNGKRDVIHEAYELEPYTIGVVNDAIFISNMKRIMPYLTIKIYESYDEIYQDLEKKMIDYGIIPERLFQKKISKSNLINSGIVTRRFHYVYSKNNEEPLLDIINKCLTTINMDSLVKEEVAKLIQDEEPFYKIFLYSLIVFFIVGIIIYQIMKRNAKKNKQLYFDEATMLHNELWLKNKLKINYTEYTYFLAQPQNLKLVLEQYGTNAYKKALKVLVTGLKDHIDKDEHIVKLGSNQFLIIKKKLEEQDRIVYLHNLKTLFNRRFTIFDINFSYEMKVVSLHPYDEIYTYEKLIKELGIGLRYAEYTRDVVDYTYDVYSKVQNKIEYDTKLSSAIMHEKIFLKFNRIVDREGKIYGYDVTYSCNLGEWGEVNFVNLKRNVSRLGLETIFDKVVLKKLFESIDDPSYTNTRLFIEVNKKTLENTSFFLWITEKLESLKNIQLFFKVDIDCYEKLLDAVEDINYNQLNFVLAEFDQNLLENTVIKEYDIPIAEINASVFLDIECNEELIDFIIFFSKKHHKKILITAIKTVHQYQAIQNYDIDYYVDNFRGNENESIDC